MIASHAAEKSKQHRCNIAAIGVIAPTACSMRWRCSSMQHLCANKMAQCTITSTEMRGNACSRGNVHVLHAMRTRCQVQGYPHTAVSMIGHQEHRAPCWVSCWSQTTHHQPAGRGICSSNGSCYVVQCLTRPGGITNFVLHTYTNSAARVVLTARFPTLRSCQSRYNDKPTTIP